MVAYLLSIVLNIGHTDSGEVRGAREGKWETHT